MTLDGAGLGAGAAVGRGGGIVAAAESGRPVAPSMRAATGLPGPIGPAGSAEGLSPDSEARAAAAPASPFVRDALCTLSRELGLLRNDVRTLRGGRAGAAGGGGVAAATPQPAGVAGPVENAKPGESVGWEAAAEIWGEVRALEEEVGKMRRSAAAEQVRVLCGCPQMRTGEGPRGGGKGRWVGGASPGEKVSV